VQTAGQSSPARFRRISAGDAGSALRRVLVEGSAASLAYAIVAILVTWPLATKLGSSVIGGPASDVGGTVAWLWSLPQEGGYHVFGATEHTLTGAPLPWEQGNAANLQWLPTYYPAYLTSLVAGEVVAYNLTILSGLMLSALGMYALTRRLGCSPLVAAWSGLVFMFFPWHIWRVNAGHASLVHLEAFPLLFIALHAWTERPTLRRAAIVGLATTAAWLFSGYWGAMAVIGAVAFALAVGAVRARRDGIRRTGTHVVILTAAVLLGSLTVGLLSLPGRTEAGITVPRVLDELAAFSARPAEFVAPPLDTPVIGRIAGPLQPAEHGSNASETTLFMGWLPIALVVLWLVIVLSRRRLLSRSLVATTAGLFAVLLAGLAFAAPSPIVIRARAFVWTPSWVLFHVLPEIRVPSRFVALVAAALYPLAALGLQFVCDRVRDGPETVRRGNRLALVAAVVALLVSTVELFPNFTDATRADRPPAVYGAVERTPRGVLAEYPIDEGSDYKFWQRLHGRRILNGAGVLTSSHDLARGLVNPAMPGTAEALALLGVTAIVTHPDALDYTDNVPDVPNAEWGDGYELVERFPDGSSVWRVVARPAPAVAMLPGHDFADPGWPREGFIGYPMWRSDGKIELLARTPGKIRLSLETDAPKEMPRTLQIAGATGKVMVPLAGRGRISLDVFVPRGRSRLILMVDPPSPPGEVPSVELSAPRASRTEGRPALRAELVSPDPEF
jgi:hypothetical protein